MADPRRRLGFGSSLLFLWFKASHFEVRNQLVGDLSEDRLSQRRHGSLSNKRHVSMYARQNKKMGDYYLLRDTYIFKISKWDKLNDVSGYGLSHSGPENAIVSIQKLHGLKIGWPHSHNNNRQGQLGCPDYGIPGLVQVSDFAISEDQENKVLL
ncbi:hypothetical protein XENOCAPTIV_020644 [Xenoophorus captivus]|uniref:Uncharacterized protein n=1 Tax=Xenoophorus captivus TaxID=1517983 RepID=A0ABV0RX79_9TELE